MKHRLRILGIPILATLLALTMLCPPEVYAFWGQDALETAGIVTGITLGACLLIVLVAGTMIEFGDDSDDVFSRLPIEPPPPLVAFVSPPEEQGRDLPPYWDCRQDGSPRNVALAAHGNHGGENKEDITMLLAHSRTFTQDLVEPQVCIPSPMKSSLTHSRAVFLK